jgi:hypothetical protein
MKPQTDLSTACSPDDVEQMLLYAAKLYRKSAEEIGSRYSNPKGAQIWHTIAGILEIAAEAIQDV